LGKGFCTDVSDLTIREDAPLSIIRNAFPQRKVIGVNGKILAQGGGGVHCITQQVPLV